MRFRFSPQSLNPLLNLHVSLAPQVFLKIPEQFNEGRGITTLYEYNPLNEITAVIDNQDNTTDIRYDTLGRRISVDNPDSGLVESFYDLAGNLVKKIDNNLRATDLAIDYDYEYNRLMRIKYQLNQDVEYYYGEPSAEENRAGRLEPESFESRFGYDWEEALSPPIHPLIAPYWLYRASFPRSCVSFSLSSTFCLADVL